jgi:hypothetical protein
MFLDPDTFTRKRPSSAAQDYSTNKNIRLISGFSVPMNEESTTYSENTGNEPISSPQGENIGTFGKGGQ